ncbi:hypothetical protein [Chitinibacter tainanensis]|uniref:hypothetical protein n=1 Tax=Chitinibacter tainanensis TaxID=230667 RepID=UPI0023541E01|nr:hypothetical protein [Chitinibacter tainanensis]
MNNAEKALVEQLLPTLSAKGFKWLKTREMFIRKEPHGFSSLSWTSHSTNDEGGRLELGLVLGVRHDIVDDVVNELGLIYGDDNKKFTTTVARGLSLFPFKEGKDYKQCIRLVSVDADVQNAASGIVSILDEDGWQFFERFASLSECAKGLNDPIESKTHPLYNNFPRRAYYGVASAFFADNSQVTGLIHQYLEFAKVVQPNQYDQISKRFDQLIATAQSRRCEA